MSAIFSRAQSVNTCPPNKYLPWQSVISSPVGDGLQYKYNFNFYLASLDGFHVGHGILQFP